MDSQSIAASSQPADKVLKALSVQSHQGLTTAEVEQRQQEYGPNRLQQVQRRSRQQIFVAQFKSPIIALLAVGEGNPTVMQHPPRDSQEPILTRRDWIMIGVYGLIIAAAVLGIFAVALQVLALELEQAVTISFLSLAFARLWHVFNMRESDSNLLRNEITTNPYIWGALVICTGLLLVATYAPGLSDILQLVDPGLQGWGLILGTSLLPLVLGQLVVRWR
jgi:magnesium-transporting ATPase (P-type)